MAPDRVFWHLWNWANWQRCGGDDGDYESRASSGIGRSSSRDFDAMVAEADSRCAMAVEAILDNLTSAQRCAVHVKHLDAVYRLRDLEASYDSACLSIGRGLDRRGIV